jgi:hypothetical protein
MRRALIVSAVALVGCGGGGLQGTLRWEQPPTVSPRGAIGNVKNITSHSVKLAPGRMRLLDNRGRKVAGRVRVGRRELASGDVTSLRAVWKSGNPVRIDYGAGTLALPSP